MLEVLTSRYYRIETLRNFRPFRSGRTMLSYRPNTTRSEKLIHVFTTHCRATPSSAEACRRARFLSFNKYPQRTDVVIDFCVWHPEPCADDPETTESQIRSTLNQVGFPRPIRRIVVAIAGQRRRPRDGRDAAFHIYARRARLLEEDKFFRGIHPMMAKRLHLWRLTNFKIERLPVGRRCLSPARCRARQSQG